MTVDVRFFLKLLVTYHPSSEHHCTTRTFYSQSKHSSKQF